MTLWSSIKNKPTPPISIANPDITEAIDPTPGAPINGARTPGLKFTPVEPAETLLSMDMINGSEITFDGLDDELLSSPHLDLVTDDPGDVVLDTVIRPANDIRERAARKLERTGIVPDKGGRPRVYATNADRQKAYRDRNKRRAG